MEILDDLQYTREHEWLLVDNGIGTIGITDYAQRELTDITFVELLEVGTTLTVGGVMGTVDGIKAVSEIYSPVDGTIVEINTLLENHPELVNDDPYGEGWMIKIKLTDAVVHDMLTPEEYSELIQK